MCGKGEEAGCANGPAAEARFNVPVGLALDMNEDLIVADFYNKLCRATEHCHTSYDDD